MIPSHHTQYSEAHPKATDNPEVPPKQCCWPTSLCPPGGTLPQATASLPHYMLQFKQDFSRQLNAFAVHTFHSHEVALGKKWRPSL